MFFISVVFAICKFLFKILLFDPSTILFGESLEAIFNREELIQKLTDKALRSADGCASVRLGPPIPYLYTNLVVIVPKSTEQLKNLTDAIESQPLGRKILKPLENMVNHPTMANLTVKEGAMFQRSLLVPFTTDMTGFLKLGREMFRDSLNLWSQNKNGIVLLDEIKYLIRKMSAKRILGIDLTKEENDIIEETLVGVKSETTNILPFSMSFFKTKKKYEEFSKKLINANILQIEKGLGNRKENFFSEIIKNMTDYSGDKKSLENYINHPLVTSSVLVIATLDGIYTNLTSIMLQILDKPYIAKKLYAEILAKSCDGTHIPDEILKNKNQLPYLHLVYMEGLRFNSSLPILARYTKNGFQTEENVIPSNSNVLINLKGMHFNQNKWGKDSQKFIPERFLRSKLRDIQIGKAPFIPFSLGQRQCPGIRVGELMIKLFITEFILNYNIEASPNQPPPTVSQASLAPDPGPNYFVNIHKKEQSFIKSSN